MAQESLFDKLEAEAFRQGLTKRSRESMNWFRRKVDTMSKIPKNKMIKDPRLIRENTPKIGDMYMYHYDPKHKKTLPFYDTFPLVIMVKKAPGGFYGINLHYLPLKHRAVFLDHLLNITNNKKYDETTRMKLSYNLLKGAQKYKYFKPCFKHYLTAKVDSNVMKVQSSEWDVAIFLPIEQFQKARKTTVWADSRSKY
tara:strand:+ start:1024 stop:1614 length:591 start_codon:yes stop_codon:yes gene_type:complete